MRLFLIMNTLLYLVSCSDGAGVNTGSCLLLDNDTSNSGYGEYVSIERQYSLSKEYVTAKIAQSSPTASAAVSSGVHVYKISYNSKETTTSNDTVQASGSLFVPYTACSDESNTAPWMVLNHGTIVDNASAPTNNLREGLFEGGLGFITVVPDYIGFGDSYSSDPSVRIHPYIIADTYAADGYAIMNASKQVLASNGITPGRLYLKGYSEGGYATLALQKYLEDNKSSEYTITASAPSAGPYSTVALGAQLTTALADTIISPTLMAFLATSYFYNYPSTVGATYTLNGVFKQSDQYDVANIFNGEKSSSQTEAIYSGLGINTINTLLESNVVSALAIGSGTLFTVRTSGTTLKNTAAAMTEPFSLALYENDLVLQTIAGPEYFPQNPTIFYHCSDDQTIYPDGTTLAVGTYQSYEAVAGITTSKIFTNTSQTGGHSGCAYTLTPSVCFKEIEAAISLGSNAAAYLASPQTGSMCNN